MTESPELQTFLNAEINAYCARTPRSRAEYDSLCEILPGGNTRTQLYFPPYPIFVERADGAVIIDIDGNEAIDLIGNYGVVILGHGQAYLSRGVADQIGKGAVVGAPTRLEGEVARQLRDFMPSLESIRFANSGSEATLQLIRAARAYSGRERIAKFEGAYHGTHDLVDISIKSGLGDWGPSEAPRAVANSAGIPESITSNVLILPFNDLSACEDLIRVHARDLAVICIEPLLNSSGVIPPDDGFIEGVVEAARSVGVLVMFDEVFSFRVARGGMQGLLGLHPDLTALGKGIAGGLPFGAFGGRTDIMRVFDPADGRARVSHAGTFNANPVSLRAAIDTLPRITESVFSHTRASGEHLRNGLNGIFSRHGIAGVVTGVGPVGNIHFGVNQVRNVRDTWDADATSLRAFILGMLNRGVYIAPRGFFCVSDAVEDGQLAAVLDTAEEVLGRMMMAA